MKTNKLNIDERILLGQQRENSIISLLHDRDIKINGQYVSYWVRNDDPEVDKIDKIDAYAMMNEEERIPAQIKYRDDGPDIGVAAVMPYVNHQSFQAQYAAGSIPWDRDMRGKAELLVCLSADGGILTVVSMETVHRGVKSLLKRFANETGFDGKSYRHEACPGAEIRVVKDRGAGYSVGKYKLVVYFTPVLMEAAGAYVHRYYLSPEDMEPGR